MTYPISDITRRVVYSGSLGTGPYPFTFEILEEGDIGVYKNQTLLTLSADYTVTINADGTGEVDLVSAATSTDTVAIFGDKGIQRQTDFTTGGDLFANSLNDELDAQTIFAQQNAEAIVRAIRAPQFDPTNLDMTLPSASDRADTVLTFDTNGEPQATSNSDFVAGLSGSILGANYVTNTAVGDGSTVNFTVSVAPGAKGNIQIYIDGVYQNKASFSVSGTTVTFTEAPPLNSSIEFMIGYAIGSASGAGSISFTQAGTGAVTRTVESKLQDVVSVKDFGAVGDGVADDTAAIKNAIAASLGNELFFPSGTYLITDSLNFSDNSVRGIPDQTIIKPTTGFSTSATEILRFGTGTHQHLYGIKLDTTFFTSANQATYPSLATFIECASQYATYDTVHIYADDTFNVTKGMSLTGNTGANVLNCRLDNIRGNALWCAGHKIIMQGNRITNVPKNTSGGTNRAVIGGQATEIIFNDNYIENTEWVSTQYDSVCAVDFGGADRVVITGNVFKDVAVGTDFESSSGSQPGKSTDILCSNNVFSAKSTGNGNGIWINLAGSGQQDVVITSNIVTGFDKGIATTYGSNVTVNDNLVRDSSGYGIHVSGTSKIIVNGNNLEQTSGDCIRVESGTTNWNNGYSGGLVQGNHITCSGVTNAIYVTNTGPTAPALTPDEPFIVTGNLVKDDAASGSRTSLITTIGRVISNNNTQNHIGAIASNAIDARYGNIYAYDLSSNTTIDDITNASFGQTVDVTFRVFSGNTLTIDFTGSELTGNGGVDYSVTAVGVEKHVRLKAEYIYTGYNSGQWMCFVTP